MATDKTLPDADEDIIDLTDLVEEGSAGGPPSGDDGPVDMSFEQELEDLFGDAEPSPASAGPASGADASPVADEDLIDLNGLGLDETPETVVAGDAADAEVVDLAGLGLDDLETSPPTAGTPGEAPDDALEDLFGEAGAKAPGGDEDLFSGLDFEAPPDTAADASGDAAGEDLPSPAAETHADGEIAGLSDILAETPADGTVDLADMDLADFAAPDAAGPGAVVPEAASEAAEDAAMADLLGELPEVPAERAEEATDIADLADLPAYEEATPPAAEPEAPSPGVTADPALAAMGTAVAGAAAVGAMAGAMAVAPASPRVGAIDLGALDQLIDTAKGPLPEPEPEPEPGRLDALADRIASLESTTATLFDKIETMPPATDGEALADALSARLEDALSERLEAVLAGQPPVPDAAAITSEVLAAIGPLPDHAALLADLQAALAPQFEALRQELPQTESLAAKAETAAALDSLRESLVRLEALTQGRQTKFEDFVEVMEARFAALHRELPQPGSFASTESVGESLETLRENLARDIAANLDERLAELRRELRQSLADDMAATLDDRLAEVAATARQAALEEIGSLGEALSSRLEALEHDRVDPDALADRIRDTLLASLPDPRAVREAGDAAARAEETSAHLQARLDEKIDRHDLEAALAALRVELIAEMEQAVPRAAAAVIREEIDALVKDFV